MCKVCVSQSAQGGEGSREQARGQGGWGEGVGRGSQSRKRKGHTCRVDTDAPCWGPTATASSPLPQLRRVSGARGAATCGVVSGAPAAGGAAQARAPARARGTPGPRPAARGPHPARGSAAVPRSPPPGPRRLRGRPSGRWSRARGAAQEEPAAAGAAGAGRQRLAVSRDRAGRAWAPRGRRGGILAPRGSTTGGSRGRGGRCRGEGVAPQGGRGRRGEGVARRPQVGARGRGGGFPGGPRALLAGVAVASPDSGGLQLFDDFLEHRLKSSLGTCPRDCFSCGCTESSLLGWRGRGGGAPRWRWAACPLPGTRAGANVPEGRRDPGCREEVLCAVSGGAPRRHGLGVGVKGGRGGELYGDAAKLVFPLRFLHLHAGR